MAKRTSIMLCQPFEERRLQRWNVPEVIVQPKLDGERCRAFWDFERKEWVLVSSEGNEFLSVPHIGKELEELGIPHSYHLDGELYIHNATFNDIHSIVSRKVHRHLDASSMEYHVFDLLMQIPMAERTVKLWDLDNGSCIKLVPSILCEATPEVILKHMTSFTQWGYEGIIVRHPGAPYEMRRSPYVMKFKPRKSDVYRIMDTQEEISKDGKPKNSLGALVCCSDGGTLFGVGSGFTKDQREELWSQRDSLPGKFVEVYYQALTPAHVPRFPVFKTLIRGE